MGAREIVSTSDIRLVATHPAEVGRTGARDGGAWRAGAGGASRCAGWIGRLGDCGRCDVRGELLRAERGGNNRACWSRAALAFACPHVHAKTTVRTEAHRQNACIDQAIEKVEPKYKPSQAALTAFFKLHQPANTDWTAPYAVLEVTDGCPLNGMYRRCATHSVALPGYGSASGIVNVDNRTRPLRGLVLRVCTP